MKKFPILITFLSISVVTFLSSCSAKIFDNFSESATAQKPNEDPRLCDTQPAYSPKPNTLEAKTAEELAFLKPKYGEQLSKKIKDAKWLKQYGYDDMMIEWDGNKFIPVVIYNKSSKIGKYLTLFFTPNADCNSIDYIGSLKIDLANIKNNKLPLVWTNKNSNFGSRLDVKIVQKSTNSKNVDLADTAPIFFYQDVQPENTTVKWRENNISPKSPLRAILIYNETSRYRSLD